MRMSVVLDIDGEVKVLSERSYESPYSIIEALKFAMEDFNKEILNSIQQIEGVT